MNNSLALIRVAEKACRNVIINDSVYVNYSDDIITNTRYWLVYGILSSGVKDQVAITYSKNICAEFASKDYNQKCPSRMRDILNTNTNFGKYRFPNTRSEWLHSSFITLQANNNQLPFSIEQKSTKQRDTLVSTFKGIGLKQASLLLRNLGYCYDCCVVDTHIIDFLVWIGWLHNSIKTLPINRKRYFAIESLFKRLAHLLAMPIAILDIAVWNVTRVLKTGRIA